MANERKRRVLERRKSIITFNKERIVRACVVGLNRMYSTPNWGGCQTTKKVGGIQ